MRAGSLRHLVTVEQPVIVTDSYGAPVTTWTTFCNAYASIEIMKSFDKSVAAATWPGADITITMRYVAGITGNMRIVYGDTIYSILGQPNDVEGRHREIILTCESGVKVQ